MSKTITLNDLAKRVLAHQLSDSLSDIELIVEKVSEDISINELSQRVLNPNVTKATPEIDFQVEELASGVEVSELQKENLRVKHIRAWIHTRGVKFAIFVFALFSLMCNFIVWLIWTFSQGA